MEKLIPQNMQRFFAQEQERVMRNVVQRVGQMVEWTAASMLGDTSENGVVEMVSTAPEIQVAAQQIVRQVEATQPYVDIVPDLEAVVERALSTKLQSMLTDVDYRIGLLYDVIERMENKNTKRSKRVGSRDLNLAQHILDGFTITNNSPGAGSVAWANCNIMYRGTNHVITNGNTNLRFVYWMFATPTVFTANANKILLGPDDILVGINTNGTFHLEMLPGKFKDGGGLIDGSVRTLELADNAVTSAKLAALQVLDGHIATNAVTTGKIIDGAVTTVKIGANQVTTDRIAAGNITAALLATNAVTTPSVADGAITTTKIGANQITNDRISAGAVAASRLNLALHMLH